MTRLARRATDTVPVSMPCPDCGKEVPTKLLLTRRELGPGCWAEEVQRVVVEHGCEAGGAVSGRGS